jgi:hypothetical protein
MTKAESEIPAAFADTRAALAKADEFLAQFSDHTVAKPAATSHLVEPTLRFKERLELELIELAKIANELGL